MVYLISCLEGIITFISPCLLPLLPVYLSYCAGQNAQRRARLLSAVSFVAGFSLVFIALGVFAGTLGALLARHRTLVNLLTGIVVILFGLSYLDLIRLPFLHQQIDVADNKMLKAQAHKDSWLRSFLFGLVFSIAWTPCVSTFLGSALMLAAQRGSTFEGFILLSCYSLGLGLPFILSTLLIGQLQSAFAFIKQHYLLITRLCGIFLVFMGLAMASGFWQRWLARLSTLTPWGGF
jgi:cytochrome c-type biogenesis protein